MGDPSSFFGGNTLASLFGLGTAAAPTGVTSADQSAVTTGFDPATGLPYPTSTYDPTGSLSAQAAVTGTTTGTGGPSTSSDTGGTQSDQSSSGQKTDAAQPASTAPSGPAPVTPQSIAAMMAGKPLPTQSASNPWVPGGGAPASPYFSEAQRNAGLQMLAVGQGIPTGGYGPSPNQAVADRYGDWQSIQTGPESAQRPAYQPAQPTTPPGQMAGADQPTGTPSNTGGEVPPEQPDDTDKTDKTPSSQDKPADTAPPAAAPPPSQPPSPMMAPGGMPGGVGNILSDLMGIMSGNPMALGKLVQDAMRMGGGMGMGGRQMPGWNQPWMLPNQAGMHTMPGDPSTFGGPQYAGMVPGGGPPGPQQFRPGIGPGQTRTGYARTGPVQRFPTGRTPPGDIIPGQAAPRLNTAPGQTVGGTGGKPFNVDANPRGTMAAPSMRGDGSFPVGPSSTGPIIATTLRRSGLNNNAIQGIMYNVQRESSFNPTLRHADQPKFGGEAHYAHGLYQEGGDEWNNYQRWLGGRNWRDPQLQTQFLAENMQRRYPRLWNALKNAQSPEQAASLFAQYYLRPSAPNLVARLNDIRSGAVRRIGVPADQPANMPMQTAGVTQ